MAAPARSRSCGTARVVAKPLVGITTYVTPAAWGHWEMEAALVPAQYVQAVERAGGRPLLVPPSPDGKDELLDAIDGLIFSGGFGLEPERYRQEPHPETKGVHPKPDRAEVPLLAAAPVGVPPVRPLC